MSEISARGLPTEKSMEKAREIAGNHYLLPDLTDEAKDELSVLIATALDSAIAETREECAQAVDKIASRYAKLARKADADEFTEGTEHYEACSCIAGECSNAIRATGKESKR